MALGTSSLDQHKRITGPPRLIWVRSADPLVRAGSAWHQKPQVPNGHERSPSANEHRRSRAVHHSNLGVRSTIGQGSSPSPSSCRGPAALAGEASSYRGGPYAAAVPAPSRPVLSQLGLPPCHVGRAGPVLSGHRGHVHRTGDLAVSRSWQLSGSPGHARKAYFPDAGSHRSNLVSGPCSVTAGAGGRGRPGCNRALDPGRLPGSHLQRPDQPVHHSPNPPRSAQGPRGAAIRDYLRPQRRGRPGPSLRHHLRDRGQPTHQQLATGQLPVVRRPAGRGPGPGPAADPGLPAAVRHRPGRLGPGRTPGHRTSASSCGWRRHRPPRPPPACSGECTPIPMAARSCGPALTSERRRLRRNQDGLPHTRELGAITSRSKPRSSSPAVPLAYDPFCTRQDRVGRGDGRSEVRVSSSAAAGRSGSCPPGDGSPGNLLTRWR